MESLSRRRRITKENGMHPVRDLLMISSKTYLRNALFGLIALGTLPASAVADQVVVLDWGNLLPEAVDAPNEVLRGVVQHGGASLASQQPPSSGVPTDWDGKKNVRLLGFIVSIDFEGSLVTAFILAPCVGTCIHVPSPPRIQLVFVTTETPYEFDGLFEAVSVNGVFGTDPTSTRLAEVGYALSADRIEPYEW